MSSVVKASIVGSAGLTLLVGCGLVGTWSTIKVEPDGAPFPITSVTFAEDGTYCVARASGGRTETSSGVYEWDGLRLTLEAQGRLPQTFFGYLRLDDKLVLTRASEGRRVTAVLEKQRDEQTATPP